MWLVSPEPDDLPIKLLWDKYRSYFILLAKSVRLTLPGYSSVQLMLFRFSISVDAFLFLLYQLVAQLMLFRYYHTSWCFFVLTIKHQGNNIFYLKIGSSPFTTVDALDAPWCSWCFFGTPLTYMLQQQGCIMVAYCVRKKNAWKLICFEWKCQGRSGGSRTSSGRANSGPIIQAGQLRPGQLRPVPFQAHPNSGQTVLTQAGAISGPSQFRPSCPNSGRCHFRPIPIQANPIPSQANLSQFRSILYQA